MTHIALTYGANKMAREQLANEQAVITASMVAIRNEK